MICYEIRNQQLSRSIVVPYLKIVAEDGDCSSATDRQMLLVEMIVDLAAGMGHMWNVGIARTDKNRSRTKNGSLMLVISNLLLLC